MVQFTSLMFVILVFIAIPLFGMWSQRGFVGQQVPPMWAKQLVALVVTAGIGYGVFRALASYRGQMSFENWLEMAVIAGACLTGLGSFYESSAKKPAPKRLSGEEND